MKWFVWSAVVGIGIGLIAWLKQLTEEPEGTYRQQLANFQASCADLKPPIPYQDQVRTDVGKKIARFKKRMEA